MVNESRIYKEARFISKNLYFNKIILFGIGESGLNKHEILENNIYIHRISFFNIKKRSIIYLYYYLYMLFYITFKKPAMINIHTLEFLPLAFLAKFFKIKVIYDTHEYETEKSHVGGFRKNISKRIESMFINYVDKVIVVGETISDEYKKLYPNLPRPYVVLNTPSYKDISQNYDYFREKLGISNDKKILLYQGGFAKGRGIEILLDSFKLINENKSEKFSHLVIVFMGDGSLENKILEYTKECENIYLHPSVSSNELLTYTSSADYGILFYENTCLNHYYCSPNKMFEYFMAELPVVCSNLFEMKRLVEKYNLGIVAKENTKEGFIKALIEVISLDKNKLVDNIKKVKQIFNWEEQEKVLNEVYGLSK